MALKVFFRKIGKNGQNWPKTRNPPTEGPRAAARVPINARSCARFRETALGMPRILAIRIRTFQFAPPLSAAGFLRLHRHRAAEQATPVSAAPPAEGALEGVRGAMVDRWFLPNGESRLFVGDEFLVGGRSRWVAPKWGPQRGSRRGSRWSCRSRPFSLLVRPRNARSCARYSLVE